MWHLDDPTFLYETYCNRGPTSFDDLDRLPLLHCVPKPDAGCDPCMIDRDAVDAALRERFQERATYAECPSDYAPSEIIEGCFGDHVDLDLCCWTSEFHYDTTVCDPGPASSFP